MSIGQLTVAQFLAALGARTPAPGGGAAGCLAGAVGAALARMVAAYAAGPHPTERPQAQAIAHALANAASLLLHLADEDARAYAAFHRLVRLPAGDPDRQGLPEAAARIVEIPLAVLAACAEALRHCVALSSLCPSALRGDLAIAADLLHASARAADRNLRLNVQGPLAEHLRQHVLRQAGDLLAHCVQRHETVLHTVVLP